MSDFSMMELFRVESENQAGIISQGLIDLERDGNNPATLESLMRAAHSIKGAARIINLPIAVSVAHAMEDCFIALQKGAKLSAKHIDWLLKGADQITRVGRISEDEVAEWSKIHADEYDALAKTIHSMLDKPEETVQPIVQEIQPAPEEKITSPEPLVQAPMDEKVLRINAERLDQLMGLAAESMIESLALKPFTQSMLQLKRKQDELTKMLESLHGLMLEEWHSDQSIELIMEAQKKAAQNRDTIAEQLEQFDLFERRSSHLSKQLYREATQSRMRPFSEVVTGYHRLVRDLAKDLDKEVKLEIIGLNTQVDRDILEKLQAPLNHLIRNAIDHGIESPKEREQKGKPREGLIRLHARHQAGMLYISVSDDGKGIDPEALRQRVIQRNLASEDLAKGLSTIELYDFLFLPNFTLRDQVTEISGRGVGLDVVLSTLQHIRGSIKTTSEIGLSTKFQLQLPLTLSVIRGLIVEISSGAYVFPLVRIDRLLILKASDLQTIEGRDYFILDGESIGLIAASQLLELNSTPKTEDLYHIVVISDRNGKFGVMVDRFMMERSLVVQTLDPRLGKIQDIMASTLLDNGIPALILDVDDLTRSIDRIISQSGLKKLETKASESIQSIKHILVVDDSFTVREVERKLLESKGYRVSLAVDGMDGWNALRTGDFDMVISDVDMPRMNGIELVELIKKDPQLKRLPVMIVSYKEREEDRQKGLKAGANYYLTKSSFQDETLLDAVASLIGKA